ncbi:uncharacterized protein BO96DRAFT_469231 [Aspergillus niger CBS 101883]|uniref:Uncharacterized protein n=2 Tax=Aspergillus niger TaxID=5061 RepID=A2QSE4_ASPNC|nr:uncharacterized protein BO96DRAFT_469231 [Aspergillus niger CBS 101883]XP_059604158.1 hypothetical protein An08g10430 [Aspergillus niger]PYH52607.1 hypothetical protein BO96DRAFT_469231 [Aspergillus niger CBS 101883]CAK45716.1 hypothetical protein An08g10430 [Aspergillus niger]
MLKSLRAEPILSKLYYWDELLYFWFMKIGSGVFFFLFEGGKASKHQGGSGAIVDYLTPMKVNLRVFGVCVDVCNYGSVCRLNGGAMAVLGPKTGDALPHSALPGASGREVCTEGIEIAKHLMGLQRSPLIMGFVCPKYEDAIIPSAASLRVDNSPEYRREESEKITAAAKRSSITACWNSGYSYGGYSANSKTSWGNISFPFSQGSLDRRIIGRASLIDVSPGVIQVTSPGARPKPQRPDTSGKLTVGRMAAWPMICKSNDFDGQGVLMSSGRCSISVFTYCSYFHDGGVNEAARGDLPTMATIAHHRS